MIQDDRTIPAEQALKYMKELRARKVPYAFQTLSSGLVTVSTYGTFATASYDAFMETWEERFPGEDSLKDVVTRHNRMIDETQGPKR